MKLQRLIGAGIVMGGLVLSGIPAYAQTPETAAAVSKPKLEVNQTSFDFGYVPQGVKISHVFWLKNVGGDVLHIQDVKPG